jgi:hypothetical protein
MLTICTEPGCTTFVMGGRCVEHESPQTHVFVRGRPFESAASAREASARQPRLALLELAGDPLRGAPLLAVAGSQRKSDSPVR